MTDDPEAWHDEETEEFQMRPDVLFTINNQIIVKPKDYDLEEEEDGFYCHECGWRSLTLPMNSDSDNIMAAVCPECGEEGVENKLRTHCDEIQEIFAESYADEEEFVPYSYIAERFSAPQDRLDEALNHMLTNQDGYVVFDNGEAQINIQA